MGLPHLLTELMGVYPVRKPKPTHFPTIGHPETPSTRQMLVPDALTAITGGRPVRGAKSRRISRPSACLEAGWLQRCATSPRLQALCIGGVEPQSDG